MTKKRSFFLILILGSLTAVSPFSIDMYLPGFTAIAKSLHTDIEKVPLSLSSFFIGISFGQLLYGPLLDRFGRKKPLYVGMVLYILASISCYYASSIEGLIALRFVQAIGSCAAGVAAMAMVRDLFPVEDNAKVFALLILVLGASPLVAPTVGGYITDAFGWQLIFVILATIGFLILLAVIFALPESHAPDPSFSLRPGPIISNFISVLVNPQFYTYSLCGAIAFSGLFAYISASPMIFMEVFKVGSREYGWIFALLSIGFIGSSQLNGALNKKFKSEQIVVGALSGMLLISLIFFVGSYLNVLGLVGTITMIFLFLCCVGITYPNTSAISLAPFSKNAGTAAALLGSFQMAIGSLSSFAVSLFASKSAIPMASLMLAAAVLAFLLLFFGRKKMAGHLENTEKNTVMASH